MVIEKERASLPTVVVDGGNLFWKSQVLPEADRAQRLIKAELQAEAYQFAGIDAMVPGPGDLALGVETWGGLVDKYSLPIVAANLQCEGREIPGYRVVEREGRKIGIVGVVDDGVQGCTVTDPVAAAVSAVKALGPVDLLLVLSSADTSSDDKLVAKIPEVDFIVSGGAGGLMTPEPKALEGGAYRLGSGSRGKKLGVLELTWVDGANGWSSSGKGDESQERLDQFLSRLEDANKDLEAAKDDAGRERVQKRINYYNVEITRLKAQIDEQKAASGGPANSFDHRLVDLDTEVGEHAATQALVDKAKLAITAAGTTPQPSAPVTNGPLGGSQACRGCHLTEYAQWDTTPHAHAYNALEASQRHLDDECFSCHVTGASLPGGPQRAAEVSATLRNVGCESCHGPANEHARNPQLVKMSAAVDTATCTTCHDGVRDEGRFDAATYLPKVAHQPAK